MKRPSTWPYPASPSGRYVLTHDGAEVLRGLEIELWQWIHRHHAYSVEHALRHEGYAIAPLPEGACAHEASLTPDGHGAFCALCGETVG